MRGCRPLRDEEIPLVRDSMESGSWHALRDLALLIFGIRTGFRISESLSLRVRDVWRNDRVVDQVTVQRENMKKKLEARTVVLHLEAKAALEMWCRELEKENPSPETFLFLSRKGENRPITRVQAWRIFTRAYKSAGLVGKIGTHGARKTFARRMYAKLGRDLRKTQKAMGHRSIESTDKYLAFDEEEIDDAILKS